MDPVLKISDFEPDAFSDSDPNLRFRDGDPVVIDLVPLTSDEKKIHEHAELAAEKFKRSESELMEALIAVEGSKVYSRLGYPSLYRYATDALGLSESVAYAAISVARKASVVPELRAAVNSHGLGLSKARKVLSVLDPRAPEKERMEWVQKAIELPSHRLERMVAAENPKEAVAERVVYKSAKRIELTLGVWEDFLLDLRQVQNLVSSAHGRAVTLETALVEAVRFYLERKDPERRARRAIAKKGGATEERAAASQTPPPSSAPAPDSTEARVKTEPPRRRPIRSKVLHQVRFRDRNRCRARMPDGTRCGSRRWLDVHHLKPVSEGGTDAPENLVTLCRAHHQSHHRHRDHSEHEKAGSERPPD